MIFKIIHKLFYSHIISNINIRYKNTINVFLLITSIALLHGCSEGESTEQTAWPYSDVDYTHLEISNTLKNIGPNKSLMLIFGANWCPTCRRLDASLKQPAINEYLDKKFDTIKINVGDYDKNQDLVKHYKTTLKGVPSIVILNRDNQVLERINPYKIAAIHKKGRTKFFEWIKKL